MAEERKPGDETEPGTKQAAQDICPHCSGTGKVDGEPCQNCKGTGSIAVIVGDA